MEAKAFPQWTGLLRQVRFCMSLVVRNKATGFYLESHHRWTNELERALHFNSGLRLVNYLERGGVHEGPEQLEVLVLPIAVSAEAQSSGARV